MNEIKELIDKFWSKKISPGEQQKLFELIKQSPAELKTILRDDYVKGLPLGEEEITEKRFQDLLSKLHARMDKQEIQPKVKMLPRYNWIKLVAAILIVALGAILYIYRDSTGQKQESADNIPKFKKEILKQPYNSGNRAIMINLSDGSKVTLQPGSSLSYYEPFDSKSRNISMKGEATFKVAKDKHHPFIVSANGFTTTALGTEFTVNTNKESRVTVKLLEGKVVVRATAESTMAMKDVYLLPGQQLSINTKRKEKMVINFENPAKPVKPQSIVKIPLKEALVFNEAPLSRVFSSLSKRYNVEVGYEGIEEAELQKLYFTGTFGTTEKLNGILPAICNMNGLTFKLVANSIIISKQK